MDSSNLACKQSRRDQLRGNAIGSPPPLPRMLRTLRRTSLAPTLRRLIAVPFGLCLSAVFAEPMIADQCDEVTTQLTADASSGGIAPPAVVMRADSESPRDGSTVPDGHTLHLCHCAHAHGSTLTTRHTIPVRVDAVTVVMARESDGIPPSVIGEPQLRPPRLLAT